ncbi:hypothetical protein PZA11_006110 [Diplocarpon coronariae]
MTDHLSNNEQGKTSGSESVKATLDESDVQSEAEVMDPSEDEATNASVDGSDNGSDDANNSDEEDDPYDDEYCEQSSLHICCQCEGRLFTTPNECWPWRCSKDDCKHDVCDDCGEVDEDGMTIYGSDDEGDEFAIQDPAAEQRVVVKKLRGPMSLQFMIRLLPSRYSVKIYHGFPAELQSRIAVYSLLPEPRVIYLRWSHLKKAWRYGSTPVPAVITAQALEGSSVKSVAREFLKPGPTIPSSSATIPWVNFTTDTIAFSYLRCGSREKDASEYLQAVSAAVDIIKSNANLPGVPKVRYVQMSWCQMAGEITLVLDQFVGTTGLRRVILAAHDHYREDSQFDASRREDEYAEMEQAAKDRKLQGYAFEAKLLLDGVDIAERIANESGSDGDPGGELGDDSEESGREDDGFGDENEQSDECA